MPVHRDLEAKTAAEQAHLPAELARGIDVGVVVSRDPGDASAEAETLGVGRRRRGQQRGEGSQHDGGPAQREGEH
jgi:hypothetical protein